MSTAVVAGIPARRARVGEQRVRIEERQKAANPIRHARLGKAQKLIRREMNGYR